MCHHIRQSLAPLRQHARAIGLRLRAGSPPDVIVLSHRLFHDVISTFANYVIVYFYLPRQLTSYLFLPRFVAICCVTLRHSSVTVRHRLYLSLLLRHTYFYCATSSCLA